MAGVTGRPDRTIAGSTIRIVAHGDSFTWLSGVTPYCITVVASVLSGKGITADYRVVGIGGGAWDYIYPAQPPVPDNLTQNAPVLVDAFISSTLTNYLICFAGTNDIHLGNSSGAQTYAFFQTYIAARIAAGWSSSRICVCTMLPRQNTKETQRTDYNTLLVSGASTYGYVLARLDQNMLIGQAGDENDTTYYSDTIHLTNAGQAIVAGIIYPALFP